MHCSNSKSTNRVNFELIILEERDIYFNLCTLILLPLKQR